MLLIIIDIDRSISLTKSSLFDLPGVSNTVLSSNRHFDSWLVSHQHRSVNRADSVPLRWLHKCCLSQVLQSTQPSFQSTGKVELHRVRPQKQVIAVLRTYCAGSAKKEAVTPPE